MLRHYEALGLVRPTGRSGSGYREYSGADIRRIFHVESLRSLGLSLREVGRALDDPGFAPAELVADLTRRTRERIADELALLTRLQRIGATAPAAWEDVLQTVSLLRALGSESAGRRQRAALSSAGEVTAPVEALVEAALSESDPIVAGVLRWALAQAGGTGPALLAEALDAPRADVRERAVRSLAEIPGDDTTAVLRAALTSSDLVVRRHAALALAARGLDDAVPTLLDMIVEGVKDADAADALSTLAGGPASAERITAGLTGRLGHAAGDPGARRRLTQALADVPGPAAGRALAELTRDEDRVVALTATSVLRLRGRSGAAQPG
jgi:DNA-binding transcriptional MerR regulator